MVVMHLLPRVVQVGRGEPVQRQIMLVAPVAMGVRAIELLVVVVVVQLARVVWVVLVVMVVPPKILAAAVVAVVTEVRRPQALTTLGILAEMAAMVVRELAQEAVELEITTTRVLGPPAVVAVEADRALVRVMYRGPMEEPRIYGVQELVHLVAAVVEALAAQAQQATTVGATLAAMALAAEAPVSQVIIRAQVVAGVRAYSLSRTHPQSRQV